MISATGTRQVASLQRGSVSSLGGYSILCNACYSVPHSRHCYSTCSFAAWYLYFKVTEQIVTDLQVVLSNKYKICKYIEIIKNCPAC